MQVTTVIRLVENKLLLCQISRKASVCPFPGLKNEVKMFGFVVFRFLPPTAGEQTDLYCRAFILSYMLQISIRDLVFFLAMA